MLYKTEEVRCVLTYQGRAYKIAMCDVYEYDLDNVVTLDCIVKFSSIKTQFKFFERYQDCNGYDLAKSSDACKLCQLDDTEWLGYFYSVDPDDPERENPKIKAHFVRKKSLK